MPALGYKNVGWLDVTVNDGLGVIFANVVYGANVGMIQGRGGFGFATESAQGLRVPGNIVRQKLQSDKAIQAGVLCFVDHAHASATKLLDNAVMRDGQSDQR